MLSGVNLTLSNILVDITILRQGPENANSGKWTLYFQIVTYHYDDED